VDRRRWRSGEPRAGGLRVDRIWEQLTERQGRQGGTKAMVTLIRMGREFGYEKLAAAVEQALDLGCEDVAAIRNLLMSDQLQTPSASRLRSGPCPPMNALCPTMIEYDRLISAPRRRCRHELPDRKYRSEL
jgi:hypothetical protein